MSQFATVKKSWLKVDTTADCLLQPDTPILLALGVSAKPAADAAAHNLSQPIRIPKGVGAYVKASGTHAYCTVSAMDAAGLATIIPAAFGLTVASPTQTAAVGDNVTITTTPAAADGTVTYQWFYKRGRNDIGWTLIDPTDPGVPGGNPNASAATAALVNNGVTLESSGYYRCVATDAAGSVSEVTVKLTVS